MNKETEKTLLDSLAAMNKADAMIDQLKERVAFLEKQNGQLIEALATRPVYVEQSPVRPYSGTEITC